MVTPVWSSQQPDGQIRFGWDDGTESVTAPNALALSLDSQLPEAPLPPRDEGATAGLDPRLTGSSSGLGLAAPPAPGSYGAAVAADASFGPPPAAPPPPMAPSPQSHAGGRDAGTAALRSAPSTPTPRAAAPNPFEGQPMGAPAQGPVAPQYAPGYAVKVPGGPRVRGWQEQYTEAPPEVEEGMMRALDAESQAGQIEALNARKAREQQAQQQKATDAAVGYEEDQLRELRARNLARREEELAKISEAQEDVASMRINPDAYWEGKSTFQKIGLTIALALGAGGAALSGGPNVAKEIMDRGIRDNIDAQRVAIEQKRKGVEGKVNVYGEMLRRFGDEEDAQIASQALLEKQAARTFARMAEQAKDENAAAESLRMAADYDRKAAATLSELHSKRVTRTTEVVPDRVVSGGGGITNPAQVRGSLKAQGWSDEQIDKHLKGLGATPRQIAASAAAVGPAGEGGEGAGKAAERFVPGYGYAPSPKEAQEARAAIGARNTYVGILQRIREARGSGPLDRLSPSRRAELQSLQLQATLALKNAEQMGALDAGTVEVSAGILGDASATIGLGADASLATAIDSANQSLANRLEALGLAPQQSAPPRGATNTESPPVPPAAGATRKVRPVGR